jgi:hypothetical protein
MKTKELKNPAEDQAPDKTEKELSDLLKQAMEQPGVEDVMRVFGGWSVVSDANEKYRAVQNPYPPNIVSSSSNAVLS